MSCEESRTPGSCTASSPSRRDLALPITMQTYMGHASITVTLDLYGHLMPGSEEEVVAQQPNLQGPA